MAGDPAKAPASYADVLAAPKHVVAEVLDGVLYTNRRPATPHAAATSAIGEELGPPFKRGRGRLEGERYVLVGTWGEDQHARLEPFEAIVLDVGLFWADVVLAGGADDRPRRSANATRPPKTARTAAAGAVWVPGSSDSCVRGPRPRKSSAPIFAAARYAPGS